MSAPVTTVNPFQRGVDTERTGEVSGQLDLRQGGPGRPGPVGETARAGLPYGVGDQILDRYLVDQLLGEGPVGVVYSALDQDMDVQVAVKVVLAEYFPDRASLRRFGEWMSPTRELRHENIVRVYDLVPLEGRFAVVEQMIVGRSLSEVLAERLPQGIASPRSEVQVLLTQIGEALACAHPDVVHGGLKPENILLLPAGLVVTDFSLALALDSRAYLAGHRHRRLPTRYLAPELLAGQACDHRADLYSLGVIAFELLVGIPLPSDPGRITDALVRLPLPAQEALQAALSPRPSARPDHVDDLVEGLLSAVSERTPTSPPAAVGDSTNVLDISELEVVDEEDDSDFPDEPTPVGVVPASLPGGRTAPDARPAPARPARRAAPGADLRGNARGARLPTPAAGPGARRSAPSLGFTLEPRTAESIPPAREADAGRVGPAVGGRRADPEAQIEAAPEVSDLPNIDADGKRPRRSGGFGALGGPSKGRKAQDAAEAMDFDKSLESALASAVAVPPPPAQRKKKRRRPGDEPDAEAMRNRPVAAGGEIQSTHSNPRMHLPAYDEPAVSVAEQALPLTPTQPPRRREGTAQVPIPEGLGRRGGIPWWVYLLLFGVACGAVTTGLILFKKHRDQQTADEAARRRSRLAALRARTPMAPTTGPTASGVGARAIPVRRLPPRPRALRWSGACPTDMVRVKRRGRDFCVDRFEFPNRKGEQPQVAVDEQEATRQCATRSKRLCTRKEWERACAGPRGKLYTYGRHYQADVCVTADDKGRKRLPLPAGSRAGCRSHWGAFDLSGNMAEWVTGGQLLGGSAAKPGTQTSCESDAGSGGTTYNGFRCCIDARD